MKREVMQLRKKYETSVFTIFYFIQEFKIPVFYLFQLRADSRVIVASKD